LAVDLVTNWTQLSRKFAFLSYDGNHGTVKDSLTIRGLEHVRCPHFSESDVGDPIFEAL
jgi:hypothetical protein